MYTYNRLKKLSGLLKEDETQDKLDDLSSAFEDASVETYVNLLKKYQTDPKVLAALKAGTTDGKPTDEKFSVSDTSFAAKKLKPTQNEIGAEESLKNILTDKYDSLEGFLKGSASFPDPIITYNSEYVLDGHHRWSQVYAANPNAKIPALNVAGTFDAKDILKAVHTAIAVDSGETKTVSANLTAGNLLDYTPEQVKKYVSDELTDKARKVWNANGFDSDEAIANEIAKNVETMISSSKPEEWAPSRDSMPQPGVSKSTEWGKEMTAGEVNLIAPKTSDVKESKNPPVSKMQVNGLVNAKRLQKDLENKGYVLGKDFTVTRDFKNKIMYNNTPLVTESLQNMYVVWIQDHYTKGKKIKMYVVPKSKAQTIASNLYNRYRDDMDTEVGIMTLDQWNKLPKREKDLTRETKLNPKPQIKESNQNKNLETKLFESVLKKSISEFTKTVHRK